MSAKVNGLGHIGFYVKDLDLMKDFYANFMGMTLTKVGPLGAFFSADPEAVDHEIALINGRISLEDPHWIQHGRPAGIVDSAPGGQLRHCIHPLHHPYADPPPEADGLIHYEAPR